MTQAPFPQVETWGYSPRSLRGNRPVRTHQPDPNVNLFHFFRVARQYSQRVDSLFFFETLHGAVLQGDDQLPVSCGHAVPGRGRVEFVFGQRLAVGG